MSALSRPRLLHPGAWWLWALGLATAASRTTNPVLLILIASVAAVVVSERRVPGPWGNSYGAFLKLGLFVIGIRIVLEILIGGVDVGVPLVTLPQIPLPDWMAGVSLGGLVTVDALLFAIYDGLRIAVMLGCVGAANSLVNPSRLLRIVPAALYEAGVAVVVCMTVAPILVSDVGRIRSARRLRGRTTRGPRAWGEMAMPLFIGALDRSVSLAASMDSRGYGRTAGQSAAARRLSAGLVLGGLLGVLLGLYGLLEGGTPGVAGVPVIGWPMLVAGAGIAVAGTALAGRRVSRTRYRPDPWALPEWLVSACGLLPAAVMIGLAGDPALTGSVSPPGWPEIPPAAMVAILIGALPALLSPPVPAESRPAAPVVREPAEVPA